MLRPPKGITIGVDAKGKYSVLYAGDDFPSALAPLDEQPKGIATIFVFRNGALFKTRETEETRIIRQAKLENAEKVSKAAFEKAIADGKQKIADDAKKAAEHNRKLQETAAAEAAKDLKARKAREAEVLERAAKDARAKV